MKKILIADDERTILLTLSCLLEKRDNYYEKPMDRRHLSVKFGSPGSDPQSATYGNS